MKKKLKFQATSTRPSRGVLDVPSRVFRVSVEVEPIVPDRCVYLKDFLNSNLKKKSFLEDDFVRI